MRRAIGLVLGVVVLGLCCPPGPASAARLSVCNHDDLTLYLGLGWQNDTGWHSKGWWKLYPQRCFTVRILVPGLYYRWQSDEKITPFVANPQDKAGKMLVQTYEAFAFDNADQHQGLASFVWFNEIYFCSQGLIGKDYTGSENLVIEPDGTDDETLNIHQASALMPLP